MPAMTPHERLVSTIRKALRRVTEDCRDPDCKVVMHQEHSAALVALMQLELEHAALQEERNKDRQAIIEAVVAANNLRARLVSPAPPVRDRATSTAEVQHCFHPELCGGEGEKAPGLPLCICSCPRCKPPAAPPSPPEEKAAPAACASCRAETCAGCPHERDRYARQIAPPSPPAPTHVEKGTPR